MANNMQLSFLNEIKLHKTAWRIQVKILHSWRFFMKGVGESMELILSDAHGTKIHASCKKNYMADLAKHVRVGEWRNIDHFCVSGAGNGSYRSTGHKYRLAIVGLLFRSSSNTSEICYTCHVNIVVLLRLSLNEHSNKS
ncbi:hypothetical protein Bca4012_044471 [Brassica carinata]